MPQLFNVVKCFQCSMYQVDINKKSTNKWSCKPCGAKQSLKQVYYQGEAKECRLRVQNMNKLRHEAKSEVDSELIKNGVNFSKNYELFPKPSAAKFNQNNNDDSEDFYCNERNNDGISERINREVDENKNNLSCSLNKKEFNDNKSNKKSGKWAKYLNEDDENDEEC